MTYVVMHLLVVVLSGFGAWLIWQQDGEGMPLMAGVCALIALMNVWLAWTAWRDARRR